MFRRSRTLRWLSTALLVLSTGVAGLAPPFAESATAAVQPPSPAKACCCGTKTAACCGTGCCSAKDAPAPDRNPAPLPVNGPDGRMGPLGLVWTVFNLPAGSQGRRAKSGSRDGVDLPQAGGTLQAKQVRLNA